MKRRFRIWVCETAESLCRHNRVTDAIGLWRVLHPLIEWGWQD